MPSIWQISAACSGRCSNWLNVLKLRHMTLIGTKGVERRNNVPRNYLGWQKYLGRLLKNFINNEYILCKIKKILR